MLGASPFAVAPARAADGGDGLREWANGPVRYVMTPRERKMFRGLGNDNERAEFVRNFWRRRDPDPRTPNNEARLVFWRRVVEANQKFTLPGKPGWRGDRGKIYILLGPPEDVEEREDYSSGMQQLGRGVLRWHYTNLPQAQRSHVIVAFSRGADDDWRLSDDPRFASPYFDVNREMRDQSYGVYSSFLAEGVPWGGSTLDTLMDLGRLQEGPTEADLLRAVVRSEGFLGTYAGTSRLDVLPDATGAPVLAVTVALRRSEVFPPVAEGAAAVATRFAASAQVTPPGGAPIDVDESRFLAEPAPDPADEWVRFQALVPLPAGTAGRVEVSAVVLDRVGGGAAATRATRELAPDPAGAPRVAGPFLAAALERVEEIVPPASRPFRFGEALVAPRMEPRVGASEPFSIVLEVHGDDPVTLEWAITRDGAAWGTPGRLDDGRGLRAWEMKPGALPAGSYAVTVTARSGTGVAVTRTLSFAVE